MIYFVLNEYGQVAAYTDEAAANHKAKVDGGTVYAVPLAAPAPEVQP